MDDILVIGIAGGSGSGKTTLTKRLVERFPGHITVVGHDNYYKRHDELTYEERCLINYDEPAAFETDLMVRQLQQLRRGETINCPVYDFTVHNRSKDTVLIKPAKVILVEGILILADKELCDRYSRVTTPMVNDVLRQKSILYQTLPTSILPLREGMRVCGLAFTIKGSKNLTLEGEMEKRADMLDINLKAMRIGAEN